MGGGFSDTDAVTPDSEGLYSTFIGDDPALPIPPSIFNSDSVWLAVRINGEDLLPRKRFASTPYSMSAQSVVDGVITNAKLATNAVTADKIQPNIISSLDGVSNDGGNIDLAAGNAITIIPNGSTNSITIGENHSARTDNPHNTTAAQSGALVSVEGVSNPGGNINLIAGSNIAITSDDASNTINIASNSWGLTGNTGTTPGTHYLGTRDNAALELRVNGQRAMRLEPTATTINIIGGYYGNSIMAGVNGGTIAGGGAYGSTNLLTDSFGFIGGGLGNQVGNNAGTIDDRSCATVAGGAGNKAIGYASTIGGGVNNNATGSFAAIPGGSANAAAGQYSLAAGRRAKANHAGAFVWGDSTDADVASAAANQFVVRANGGVQFRDAQEMRISDPVDVVLMLEADSDNSGESDNPGILLSQDGGIVTGFLGYQEGTNRLLLENRYADRLMLKSPAGIYLYTNSAGTAGVYLSAGGSGWNMVSDSVMKENIQRVNENEVLRKLNAVPICRWNYKTQDSSAQHMGPMAQDFHKAFGLGEDEKSINSMDADGVALAAIQGLYRMLQEKDARLVEQERRINELETRMKTLEKNK